MSDFNIVPVHGNARLVSFNELFYSLPKRSHMCSNFTLPQVIKHYDLGSSKADANDFRQLYSLVFSDQGS